MIGSAAFEIPEPYSASTALGMPTVIVQHLKHFRPLPQKLQYRVEQVNIGNLNACPASYLQLFLRKMF